MRTMRHRVGCTLVISMLYLATSVGVAAERLVVFTVNYPLQYLAQRIAEDHAEVVFPVPPGVDPAFWQPDATTIGQFQRADIILLNGAGYAKWISRVSLPGRKLVNTSAAFRDSYIATKDTVTHSHGREGEHSHAGTAFTTWLDFAQAVEQARAVRDALARRMPDQAEIFSNNFRALERDLLALDSRLQTIVARAPAKPLFASHPVYQYMTRRYSLNLKSVMWEPDEVPPASEWQNLEELRKEHSSTWMVWESEPSSDNVEHLHKLSIHSTVVDPCANRPRTGDFLTVMNSNLVSLEQVFSQERDR